VKLPCGVATVWNRDVDGGVDFGGKVVDLLV